jgi:hypothetical protein
VDILLNNVLERTGLQPMKEEHIDALINDRRVEEMKEY